MNQYLLNEEVIDFDLSAREIVDKARLAGCQAISFTANEPAVSFEYFLDIAEVAHERGLFMGCSTNGLFSEAQLERLVTAVDFVNIGLKGPDKAFYQSYCGGGDPQKVLKCMERLSEAGVHIEVTTPFVPSMTLEEMTSLAQTISVIGPETAWHVFRLLPEYKLSHMSKTEIQRMIELKNKVKKLLPYVYLVNFPGSQWIDTRCHECQTLLIERFSIGMGGAHLMKISGNGRICPTCHHPLVIRGAVRKPAEEPPLYSDPRTGYFDVGGWQAKVSMADGQTLESAWSQPLHSSLPLNAYPGDMTLEAEQWVTDEALSAVAAHRPDLLVLTYAQSAFVGRYRQDECQYQAFISKVGREVERFLDKSGYTSAILGLGDLIPTRGSINLEKGTCGLASAEEGLARLYQALPEDAAKIASLSGVAKVYTQEDFEENYSCSLPDTQPGQYVILPENGYIFLALGGGHRLPFRTESLDARIPWWSDFDLPDAVTQIRECIFSRVMSGDKVALILLDGIGQKRFPFPSSLLDNTLNGLPYASSPLQYAVISTGEAIFPDYMAAPKWNRSRIHNPFALQGAYLPTCLTQDVMKSGKKVVSLGNRSILTHSMFPAHISIECHCAALHHFGTFTVIP
jgi:pyruvate-formate lyase-activating enzyme